MKQDNPVKPNTLNLAALVPAAMLWFFNGRPCFAQPPPSGLTGEIIQVRQKDDALMRQYSWACCTDVLLDGVSKDLRIEQVNYGPGGQLQRTLINDQSAPLPFGCFAARIAEGVRGQVQHGLVGLRGLLDQYTLPSSGKIVSFIGQATISAPDANGMRQLTRGNVGAQVPPGLAGMGHSDPDADRHGSLSINPRFAVSTYKATDGKRNARTQPTQTRG